MAIAARLFTLQQVAQHPDLSWRSQPQKRASELLRPYADSFERIPAPIGQPQRWRLSNMERRRRGITTAKVSGTSQKAEHWLGLGEIWLALTFAGGRPTSWQAEPEQQFDVMCEWRGKLWLIEYQRTPLTAKQWAAKWDARRKWYVSQTWHQKPRVVLCDVTGQQAETVQPPRNTTHVRSIESMSSTLARMV